MGGKRGGDRNAPPEAANCGGVGIVAASYKARRAVGRPAATPVPPTLPSHKVTNFDSENQNSITAWGRGGGGLQANDQLRICPLEGMRHLGSFALTDERK